jgi:DNA-binding winged helix-turn-helix (wHTH) protein/tetratricopeptide (TPR) repeat protein
MVFRFGTYVADLRAGELHKNGTRIRIQQKSLRVLAALAEQHGRVVTREELQKRLWPDDTFVDFETGLNTAVSKLRDALSDSSEKPRYIETIPRRGYRFLMPVEILDANGSPPAASESPVRPAVAVPLASPRPPSAEAPQTERRLWIARSQVWLALAGIVILLAGAAYWLLAGHPAISFRSRDSVLIADFENQTGDARFDDALLTAFTIALEQSRYANVYPRTRISGVLKRMQKPAGERITPQLGLEICQRENIRGLIAAGITRTGQEYAVSAELLDPQTGAPVRSYTVRSSGEDHILGALDTIANRIRADLGESLYQIREASRPLPQVTTRSLAALKEYADGRVYWGHGKFQDAMAQYEAAVVADPQFAMAYAALGNAHYSHIYYQPELGKQEYEKALALSSRTTDRERLNIQVKFAESSNHAAEADELYRRYLRLYPDDLQMRTNYGRVLRVHGREREAIVQDQEMARITPNDARPYLDMATAYAALGKFPEALQAYARAFQLEPAWLAVSNVNQEYGFTLLANGQEEQAKQTFSMLLEKADTHASGLRAFALLDLYHGRYASAQRSAEELLSADEKRAVPSAALTVARDNFLMALVAQGQGNRLRQVQQLDAALADFKDLGPRVAYGSLVGQELARAGAAAKAQEIAARIAPLADGNDPEQTGYLSLLRGEIAAASGKYEEAQKLLTLTNPEYGRSVLQLSGEALGHAYQQAGKWDQAAASYERFLSLNCPVGWLEASPRCQTAQFAQAQCYLASGNRARAQQALGPLLDRWKDADANLPLRKQMLELEARLAH